MRTASRALLLIVAMALCASLPAFGEAPLTFETDAGPLEIYTVGHGSLYFTWNDLVVHVDPYSRVADYGTLPKADQIWITHDHPDHLDPRAIAAVATDDTVFVTDQISALSLAGRNVAALANGDSVREQGVEIEAVPAYNLVRERAPGQKFHPRGEYNGYVATFGPLRVYIAGDTECIPEMADLGPIDVAFLPINLPYTMPPEEAVGCIKVISPRVVVPYHQGNSDPDVVADALEGSGIRVEVRALP